MKLRIERKIQITLEEELESETSKGLRNGFSKEERDSQVDSITLCE